ncbi:putative guanylate binding protein [Neospora caninum Liverpool]|uniref:Putative guanylate binding protein n=1 Tax=Neospora caninum (strain Liverpool) TaxID=572307 RepID=F0VMQ9_NEOCL|nr:putative guanylate binding protein [Neospora caninum Liverpool]CBZ55005.1 putative guanylate binding protein [Neospora caninum Liverpool]|eukprot:XP_003885033.1 putative guanylate binding protein [Neospora caninum Liverpool]
MHPPVPAPRPTSRAPVEPFPACVPGNSQRVGSSLYRSPSSQRVAGASPLALSTSGPAPPMSPACFATGDLASTSLSGVEPKAQKPIRSASKNLADPSLRSAQKSVETDAAGGSHTPRRRCTDTRNGTSAKGLAGQSLKGLNAGDHLASDEELNLVATAPTSRTVSNNRTGVGMSNQNGYRTIDPWASYDARQVRDGAKQAAVFPGLHSASSLSQEPQKTWGAKGQPAGPPQPGCRGGGESGPGDAEYPYATKGSNESCSTAASNHDAARTGGATSWGRLELSDGIRYASAYLGKSFSAGTAVPGREAARGDSQALYASAASIGGDVFFRPGAGTASAPTALPVQHHASYILTDPVTHSGSAALHRAPFSQTYQTSAVVRTVDDWSCPSSISIPFPPTVAAASQEATNGAAAWSGSWKPLQNALSLPSSQPEFHLGVETPGESGSLKQAVWPNPSASSSTGLAHPGASAEAFKPQRGLFCGDMQTLLSNESAGVVGNVATGSFSSTAHAPLPVETLHQPPTSFASTALCPSLALESKLRYTAAPLPPRSYGGRRGSVGGALQSAPLFSTGEKPFSLRSDACIPASHALLEVSESQKVHGRRLSLPATGVSTGSVSFHYGGSDAPRVLPTWSSYTSSSVPGAPASQQGVGVHSILVKNSDLFTHAPAVCGLAEASASLQTTHGQTPASFGGLAPSRSVCTPPLVPSVPLYCLSAAKDQPTSTSVLRSVSAYSAEDRGRGRLSRRAFSPSASVLSSQYPEMSPPSQKSLGPQSVNGDSRSRTVRGAKGSGASSPWSAAATCNSSRSSTYTGESRKGGTASPLGSARSSPDAPQAAAGGRRSASRSFEAWSEGETWAVHAGSGAGNRRDNSGEVAGQKATTAENLGAAASRTMERGSRRDQLARRSTSLGRHAPGFPQQRRGSSRWLSEEKRLKRGNHEPSGNAASQGLQSLLDDAVAAIGAFFVGQEETQETAGKRRDEDNCGQPRRARNADLKTGKEQDGSSASPAVATLRDMSRYPATVDHTAAPVSVAYGQPVASSTASRCLPALPMAPLDSCLTADYLDFRPAVQLSPVRNVTSGISPPAVASAVSWHALSSLLASTSAPPICPPASDDSPDVSPAEAKPDAAPAPTTETVSTGAAAPALADKAEDALEKKRKTRRPAPAGLGDSVRVRDFSPSSPSSRAARVHLFCGVVARLMRPAGGAGAGSPSAQVAFQASFATPFHAASLHSGERSGSVGLTSLLLEKTAKPSNRTRLLSRPLQLIHVNRWDGREVLTIDEQAKKFLHELGTQHIAVLSICGVTQTGKSSLANLLLDDSHMRSAGGFPVGSPAVFGDRGATFGSVSPSAFAGDRSFPGLDRAEGLDEDADDFRGEEAGKKFTQRILSDGCTEGVWIQAVSSGAGDGAADGKDDFVYLILDFEGVGCTRKTVEHDQRLFTLAMLVSHYLIYTTRGVLDADAVSGLASVSLWTQRLLQRGDTGPSGHSPASLDDTSRTSLTREGPSPSEGPSVPSGWCAPPLLWILQDFNFTLSDEDDYPLTETDYLEAILATASHPATCCSPFSSSPFSSPSPFSRTCAELNLPHIRMLRQQLETLFGDRTCLALPHPLGDYQDLGAEGVGCDDATSRAFKSAREIDAEPSFGAFMASPGRPSAFSSSFPAITKRESMGRNSEVLSGPRGSARRASFVLREGSPSPGTFSASSPPLPSRNGRDGVCLETVPVSDFQPIYRRRLQQAKNVVFKECRLKAAQSVAITGAGFVKILQRMIDGINGGQVPESGSVVVVVQREECRKWKEKCEQVFMNDLREAFQSRLPMASRELQEGASALQKKALALFKMHVIGDDDVVRGYKQQLKDRLRKITDRAMEENERHGEWKARSRLRALRERLRIDEKLNERLYESMAQVNEDVERLKQEFNADIRGPSHVYQRVMNDQIDELLAKGSEIVCGALLDQSRLAEKTVHELQQRAQEAQVSLEKTLELEQQLQHRDYETEELRRALQEERAAHRGQATFRSGDFDSDDDFCDSYRRRGSYRRSGRSRVSMSDQSKCFRQKCTIM